MEQASLALRDRICRLGVPPDITADVLGAFDAQHRARLRWDRRVAQSASPVRRAPAAPEAIALRDVAQVVAPFCHDVLLYRAFIGPAYAEAARDWLGPQMWHLTEAIGGWRRVHDLPLARLATEAAVARDQSPSFLRTPSYNLRALTLKEVWSLTRPWARKYAGLSGLDIHAMCRHALTAGAWLWVMDRTDADVRRRGHDHDLPMRVMRLAQRVDEAVGLSQERT